MDGGYNFIQAEAQSGRYDQAHKLLNEWTEFVARSVEAGPVMKFAAREISRGDLWPNYQLLERFGDKVCPSSAIQFRRRVLQCVALDSLIKQSKLKTRPKSLPALAQVEWTARETGAADLDKVLAQRITEAKAWLAQMQEMSAADNELKQRLDSITRRLGGEAGTRGSD